MSALSKSELGSAATMEITLTNDHGNIFYHRVTTDQEIVISTGDFPDGAYVLIVGYKDKKESKHILIKH